MKILTPTRIYILFVLVLNYYVVQIIIVLILKRSSYIKQAKKNKIAFLDFIQRHMKHY